MQRQGKDLGLPKIEAGAYLIDALFSAGPVMNNGFGPVPLDWPNIAAYATATGAISEEWEMSALRKMSASYIEGLTAGAEGLSLHPNKWTHE